MTRPDIPLAIVTGKSSGVPAPRARSHRFFHTARTSSGFRYLLAAGERDRDVRNSPALLREIRVSRFRVPGKQSRASAELEGRSEFTWQTIIVIIMFARLGEN